MSCIAIRDEHIHLFKALPKTAILVYIHLAIKGASTTQQLVQETGISGSSIKRAIRALKSLGCMNIITRPKRNVYLVNGVIDEQRYDENWYEQCIQNAHNEIDKASNELMVSIVDTPMLLGFDS